MAAKRKKATRKKKRVSRSRARPKVAKPVEVAPRRLDRVTKEEVFISLVWVAVLVAIGIILSGTRYATPVLVVLVVGLVGSLIVLNYEK